MLCRSEAPPSVVAAHQPSRGVGPELGSWRQFPLTVARRMRCDGHGVIRNQFAAAAKELGFCPAPPGSRPLHNPTHSAPVVGTSPRHSGCERQIDYLRGFLSRGSRFAITPSDVAPARPHCWSVPPLRLKRTSTSFSRP